MAEEVSKEVCNEKHDALGRRVTTLEKIVERMHNRLPLWATFYITGITSLVVGLAVLFITRT